MIGVFECLFGRRLLKPTLFILGYAKYKLVNFSYFTGFLFFLILLTEFVVSTSANAIFVWIMLLLAVFLGAIVGYFLMSLPKLGVIFVGVWLGILVTVLLEDSVLYKLGSFGNVLFYILLAILCIIFAVLSNLIFNDIIIICTSLLGVKYILSLY